MHHSKRQNHRLFLVMLILELHKASVLAVRRLTLGLFPSYTSCFSGLIQPASPKNWRISVGVVGDAQSLTALILAGSM
ncbi:hypothetical protein Tco_0978808 [Tanacetum coccineum]|uniref:Secreted protein n=1 Tax=Tanacetum coccineum TaxID=301880 RepID=A0ABQ5ENZ8_9ASTR